MRQRELTAEEQRMLALEKRTFKYAGAKEQVIRDELKIPATLYYQRLNVLIDSEAALAHDPLLIMRLRRLRTTRRRITPPQPSKDVHE